MALPSQGDGGSQGHTGSGPAGKGNHVVRKGECIESIAYERGLFWESVWNHPENAALREARHNPNELMPGDRLHVPEKRVKRTAGATDQRHRFRRRGVPSRLHLVLKRAGEPRANEPYVLVIDGSHTSGTTSSEGEVKLPIPPNAKAGKLRVGEGDDAVEYDLNLGHVGPKDELSGVQARLNNLGYPCGEPDGAPSARLAGALRAFQAKAGIAVTGEPDAATLQALEEEHGS